MALINCNWSKSPSKAALNNGLMVLITAQLGVARPDWGQRKVRNITPGSHFHLGKLGWRHILPMWLDSQNSPFSQPPTSLQETHLVNWIKLIFCLYRIYIGAYMTATHNTFYSHYRWLKLPGGSQYMWTRRVLPADCAQEPIKRDAPIVCAHQ